MYQLPSLGNILHIIYACLELDFQFNKQLHESHALKFESCGIIDALEQALSTDSEESIALIRTLLRKFESKK